MLKMGAGEERWIFRFLGGCRLLGIHHSTRDRLLILDRQDTSKAARQKQLMLVTRRLKTPHS